MLGNDIGYRTLAHGPLLSRAGLFGFACVVMCQNPQLTSAKRRAFARRYCLLWLVKP